MTDKQFIETIMELYQSLSEVIEAYKQANEVEKKNKCLFPFNELDYIFNNALDMEKVKEGVYDILNLKDENGRLLFDRQKLWYVVHKVFDEMNWLSIRKATTFRQWAENVYGNQGHSSKGDWDKVSAYYKNHPSRQWEFTYENDRPYIEVARAMWQKFQGTDGKNEQQFLKPNRYIWHQNMPR